MFWGKPVMMTLELRNKEFYSRSHHRWGTELWLAPRSPNMQGCGHFPWLRFLRHRVQTLPTPRYASVRISNPFFLFSSKLRFPRGWESPGEFLNRISKMQGEALGTGREERKGEWRKRGRSHPKRALVQAATVFWILVFLIGILISLADRSWRIESQGLDFLICRMDALCRVVWRWCSVRTSSVIHSIINCLTRRQALGRMCGWSMAVLNKGRNYLGGSSRGRLPASLSVLCFQH